MDTERDIPGTLFRGADGNLYFIPDMALEPFRVFDHVRAQVEALFDVEAEAEAEAEDIGEEEVEDIASAQLDAIYTTLTIHEPDQSHHGHPLPKFIVISYLEETGQ